MNTMSLLSTTLVTYTSIPTSCPPPPVNFGVDPSLPSQPLAAPSTAPAVDYVLSMCVAPHGILGEFIICTTSLSADVNPNPDTYVPPLSSVVVYYKPDGLSTLTKVAEGEKRREEKGEARRV